jgi:phospholipid-transporting ATPase
VHGREAYRRNAYLVCYNFYKNALFVLPQYWYGFLCGFSGQTLFEALAYQMYNIIFASVPILWYALYDFEYEKSEFLTNPAHYIVGLKRMLFSNFVFWQWFTQGASQALVLMVICYVSQGFTILGDGTNFDFWLNG